MPRQPRQSSATGIHHVMVRGVNRQPVFGEAGDYMYFLDSLKRARDRGGANILAYCCMPNHVHMVLEEAGESISTVMHRLEVRYAGWYNRKNDRVGHLFQDRFKSLPVADDAYLLMVIRYVHANPVVAGLSASPKDYRWSSRRNLGHPSSLVDVERLERLVSIRAIVEHETDVTPYGESRLAPPMLGSSEMLATNPPRLTDQQTWELLAHAANVRSGAEFRQLSSARQKDGVRTILAEGASVRRVARVTGLDRNRVWRWAQAD